MAIAVPVKLAYQLPKLTLAKSTVDIPLSPNKLEEWLAELPLLNINQLSYQIPKYIQDLNQINIADKQRFAMLEQLRPVVEHLYSALTKRFCRRNLNLLKESQEIQWLTRELVSGMAIGYQRLLLNQAKKKIGLLNRGQYTLLGQRTIYYLSEQIRLAYMLCYEPKEGVWFDLNTTYAYACYEDFNQNKLKDPMAYDDEKGSIDTLYFRILLLSMVSPYSLRGAELEQVYFGLTPWAETIRIEKKGSYTTGEYAISLTGDYAPIYYPNLDKITNKSIINNLKLIDRLERWQETYEIPESVSQRGMSDKLLEQVITNLKADTRRDEERIDNGDGRVEIVMGLQNIDLFLDHIESITSTVINSPIPKVHVDRVELSGEELSWSSLQFYTPTIQPTSARQVSVPRANIEQLNDDELSAVRRHKFNIENESKMGACISCRSLHGSGLFVGELMFLRGYDPTVWTLGVVRWMKISDDKLNLGLYLLSAHVDSVVVNKQGTMMDVSVNALWMAGGEHEHGDTLLLPRAEFRSNNQLLLTHRGEEYHATLEEEVWHSEGFAQFSFSVQSVERSLHQQESDFIQEYMLPA